MSEGPFSTKGDNQDYINHSTNNYGPPSTVSATKPVPVLS